MSRAGVIRPLITFVAAVSLVSCSDYFKVADFAPAVGPIHVNFSCDSIGSVALADSAGRPAWTVVRKQNDPISWVVAANVTINSIAGRTPADTLPLDSVGTQGGAPGVAFLSKVKEDTPDGSHHYVIDATCQPASGPALHLLIDPEMIVH